MPIRLAVVEDDPAQMKAHLDDIIADVGFSCIGSYGSGEELLAHLRPGQCDVAVVDLQLPGKSGIETIREIKRWNPAPQCVLMTVINDSEAIFSALKAGADGYLLKRNDPSHFLDRIRTLVAGDFPMSPAVSRRVLEYFRLPPPTELPLETLSEAERQVLELLAAGLANKEIAQQRNPEVSTVRTQLSTIYRKLQARGRTDAVRKATEAGLGGKARKNSVPPNSHG